MESERIEDLDFAGFVEHAVARAATQIPDLDAEALHTILLLNRVSNIIVYDLESAVHRPAGWSFAGFRLMFVLWLAGSMPLGKLSQLTGSSRAATSALAKTLGADGLVERTSDPQDRRTVVLSLTPDGRRRLVAAYLEHHEREKAWAHRLQERERRTLIRLLNKLITGGDDSDFRARD